MKIIYFAILALTLNTGLCTALPRAVIVDIDDTLVNPEGRTIAILHEVGAELDIPELADYSSDLTGCNYCAVNLKNAGITDVELSKQICGADFSPANLNKSLWGKRFFLQGQWFKKDTYIPGSREFISRIANTPAVIIYLSGRYKEYTLEQTKAQLSQYSFPGYDDKMPGVRTELILKPFDYAKGDADFKREAMSDINSRYKVIAAIDDSPSNAKALREVLPTDALMIIPASKCYDYQNLPPGIDIIRNYSENSLKPLLEKLKSIK